MRTIRISSLVFSFCVLFHLPYTIALPVEDLYVAEVLVTDESEDQLNRGARAGLLQVLVRVSGTLEVEASSLIAGSLRNPSSYYYQYSYESTDRILSIEGVSTPARLLQIHFDPSAVARLLRRGVFPVWGSNRPSVLLWIAASDDQGRRILGESEGGEFIEQLKAHARLRGLPLLFPLLDLEDTGAISTAEVWGAFLQRIDAASVRYGPDSILTGRLQVDGFGRWTANWSYRVADQWRSVDDVAFNSKEILQRIVDRLTNELASQYALDSSRGAVNMRIEAVHSLTDYAELSRYLESLTPVVNSFVVRLQDGEVEFRLSIEGQRAQLIETIELDEKMVLITANGEGNTMHYRWLH
jgi:hypothetical protein